MTHLVGDRGSAQRCKGVQRRPGRRRTDRIAPQEPRHEKEERKEKRVSEGVKQEIDVRRPSTICHEEYNNDLFWSTLVRIIQGDSMETRRDEESRGALFVSSGSGCIS